MLLYFYFKENYYLKLLNTAYQIQICRRGGNFGMKKVLFGIFVCMLLVGTVLPVTGNLILDKMPLSATNGNILYVGGDGEGNYTKIQDAIDDANDEDTVFVFNDSSPYYENVIVDKSINLIGENKIDTIIDGRRIGDVIEVFSDSVIIDGFTIQNSSQNLENLGAGININSNFCLIYNNILINNFRSGVEILNADYCFIANNYFSNNHHAITIADSYHVTAHDNIIENSYNLGIGVYRNREETNILNNTLRNNGRDGVYIFRIKNKVIVKNNVILGNERGIYNDAGSDNRKNRCFIFENQISMNSEYGIYIESGKGNLIYRNNFENNNVNAYLEIYWNDLGFNRWNYLLKGNYWDDWTGSGYKIIDGKLVLRYAQPNIEEISIPWFNIDWFPAKEPYDI
jgi:parallel beta-helix repeat protein